MFLRRLARARRGSVLIEVGIVLPILVILFVGTFDIVNALASWRRARSASIAIAEGATNVASQVGLFTSPIAGDNMITGTQAEVASSAIAAYIPNLPSGASTSFAVTLSAVVFTTTSSSGCSDGSCVCVTTVTTGGSTTSTSTTIGGRPSSSGGNTTVCYVANVAWSTSLGQNSPAHGFTQTRSCGTLTPVPTTTTGHSSLTTLPQGLYGPYSLVVADVQYTFTPTFLTFITGPVTFLESAYLPPRIGAAADYVLYSPTTSSSICSGYY
jgi:Flp pilus assembly protein TadG